MKQIKLIALALLSVVLVAMPVFAGQTVTAPATVAYEILGAARNISLTGIRPVGLTLGNTLQTGTVLTLNLTGGALFTPSQTYFLCANDTTPATNVVQLGAGAAAAVNTVLPLAVNVSSSADVGVGKVLWLTSDSACNYAGSFNYVIGTGASVGPAVLSGNVILPGTAILMDTFAANNVAVISRQYTTSLMNAGQLVSIDFITGPADGTTLIGTSPSTNVIGGSSSLNVTKAAFTAGYDVPGVGGSFNQVLTLTDSQGNWTGLSRVFVTGGTNCTAAAAANAPVPVSGAITLHYPNAANSASITTLCVNVAGNVSLPSRTISGSYAYEAVTSTSSSALNLPASGASAVWQTWTPNGYQAFNPYMYVGTSQDTMDVFCRFYNSSSRTAQVFVDVYPADGSASARYSLASIPSNTAGTYWGSTIGALASIPVGTSYAAQFTITALPEQVNGVSFFKRSTGERQLPLYKKVGSLGQYLTE